MIKPGKLLVAHPTLEQGLFAKSVVLITEHHSRGSVGLILNKPSPHNLQQIMSQREVDWQGGEDLYTGGPLNPGALILIHSNEWFSQNTMQVGANLSISSDMFMIEKLSMGNTPQEYRFVTGIAGWHNGQLQAEINQNTWLTCDPNEDIIFRCTGIAQWRRAVEICAHQTIAQYF